MHNVRDFVEKTKVVCDLVCHSELGGVELNEGL